MFAALSDPLTTEIIHKYVDLFIALAPIVFLKNMRIGILQKISNVWGLGKVEKNVINFPIARPPNKKDSMMSRFHRAVLNIIPKKMYGYLMLTEGSHDAINLEKFPIYASHFPAGSSSRSLSHWR